MNSTESISAIRDLAKAYLDSRLNGTELVRGVDDLVAGDYIHLFDSEVAQLIDRFQSELGLYVRDEQTRREAPGVYYCDDELKPKVETFLREVLELTERE